MFALVAFGATKLGLLPKITDWSNMSPADLARQRIEHPFVLGEIERLK